MRYWSLIVFISCALYSGFATAKPTPGKLRTLSVAGVTLRFPSAWHLIDDQDKLRRINQAGEKLVGDKIPKSDIGLQFMVFEKVPGTGGTSPIGGSKKPPSGRVRHNPHLDFLIEPLPVELTSKDYAGAISTNMAKMGDGKMFRDLSAPKARKLGAHTYYVIQYKLVINGNATNVAYYAIANPKHRKAYGFTVYPDPIGLAPFEAVLATVTLPGGFVGAP